MKKPKTTKKLPRTSQPLYFWLEFLWTMTEKEIKTRYKHAVLGFLWIFLNPFLQMIVIGFVFQFFMPLTIDNYFLFLFAGLLPWNFFSFSATKAIPSIVFERALIQKAKFPREAIVLSIVLSNALHFCISLGLFLVLLLIMSIITNSGLIFAPLSQQILLVATSIVRFAALFIATVWLLSFTAGFSLLGAALNVKYRDVQFILMAIVPLWFYTTPIVYNLSLLPTQFQTLAYLNPMTGIIELFRWALLDIPVTSAPLLSLSCVVSLVLIGAGITIFNTDSKFFDDWI